MYLSFLADLDIIPYKEMEQLDVDVSPPASIMNL